MMRITVLQDIRFGMRLLGRSRASTAVAVLTLGIGIGANTAVFSVINSVLLRKPPYADAARLVTLRQKFPKIGELSLGASPAEYLDYRDRMRAFSSIAGYEDATFDLTGGPEPVRVRAERITHTLLSTLGTAPLTGRVFSPGEDQPGAANVALLSHEFWQRHLGGSLNIVGGVIRLNERPYTVVGIMPAGFEFPFTAASVGEPPALWVPMAFTAREIQDRAAEFPVRIVARIRPGVSFAQAEEDIGRVATDFQREHTDIYSGNLRLQVNLDSLGAGPAARVWPVLLTLAGAVLFVLLIACANVTNLLLARAAVRQREMAVRTALGASAGRIVAQLLTEGLLLTTAGAVLGCVLAETIVLTVRTLWSSFVAGVASVHIDLRVLLFTLVISVLTSLLCSIAPALTTGADIGGALKQGARQSLPPERRRLGGALVVLEASSAIVLLIGAGLLLHSFVEVLRVPIGFAPDRVLIARTTFNRQRYPSSDGRREAERQMAQRLAALPGVTVVGLSTHIPLADERQIGFILEGEDVCSVRWADNALVTGEYFAAMGIPLVRGRTFTEQDTPQAPIAAVVNESLARRLFANGDALGKRLLWGGRKLTIVGIAGDVHIEALDAAVNPTIYTALYQIESAAVTNAVFIVRTRVPDPGSLSSAVRERIWSVDHDVPVFDIRPMNEIVARSLSARRFTVTMLSCFAVLALGLAVIGLYGVLSYTVAQRTSELGLRLALGATRGQVLRLVLEDGLRLIALGIVVGASLGAAVARAMSRLLFGVGAFDPATFGGAAALLLVVALIASIVPAHRASRVDPMVALRSE